VPELASTYLVTGVWATCVMDASYYPRLAREMVAHAATIEDPTIAKRLRERAEEYLILANALDDPAPPLAPGSEPQDSMGQGQPKKNEE
jgi:hypothetical protein